MGRTGTHEVGHWLMLTHIWGNGGCDVHDGIPDTPTHSGPNFNCAEGTTACSEDSLQMVQNYMDYSDDSCMYLFTNDQVGLMRKAFNSQGSRVSITESNGCDIPAGNEVVFELHFDEFPQDISWELLNSLDEIIASDGDFDPGNETLNIPPPLANESIFYEFDLPDDDYTLTFYDSYGDGFPDGYYEIKTIYNTIVISGTGTFDDELSIPFTLDNAEFRFLGTINDDWYNTENWNRLDYPQDCYEGDIFIESDCVVDILTIDMEKNISIINNATLTILE